MAFLASYFMNRELSDIDIVVRVTQTYGSAVAEPADAAPPAKRTRSNKDAADEASQLAVLPGHRIVLFNSGFFKAQQVRDTAQQAVDEEALAVVLCQHGRAACSCCSICNSGLVLLHAGQAAYCYDARKASTYTACREAHCFSG